MRQLVVKIAPALAGLGILAVSGLAFGADTKAVADKWMWLTFLVFGAIISLTMYVTYLAAKRVKSASELCAKRICIWFCSPP